MKKAFSYLIFIISISVVGQNSFPSSGNAKIQNANLLIETSQWSPSLITLKDTHYNPNQVYNFQIESDGLKIKQDGTVNYQFKSGGNFIVRNGKVLLGVGNPLFKLHIKDPSGGAALGLERGGKLWRFDLQDNADRLFIGHSDNSSMVTFHKNGRVGIGITNPESPLEIVQEENVNSDRSLVISEPNNSQKIYLHLADNSNGEYGYLSLGGTTSLRGNGKPSFFEGGIGIGTTNLGSYKLAIKGKIRAEEIKVETGWADYVFKEDYNLPTLEEVENHIKQKGHLMNIPSAKEVEENGVQLGQMNKLLLEKIEELTLYTLQQEKKLRLQQEKNQKLEERLNNIEKSIKIPNE